MLQGFGMLVPKAHAQIRAAEGMVVKERSLFVAGCYVAGTRMRVSCALG
jgi:hypothetical protein